MNSNNSKIEQAFESLGKQLEEIQVDVNKIESGIVSLLEILGDIDKLNLTKDFLRNFFDKTAAWILRNFASIKLNSVINLISIILNKLDYKSDLKREDITKLLQLETYEQILISDKKEKDKSNAEILTPDSFITNQFLSSFYALIVTIANKPEIIIKSKNLLRSIITVMAQICEIDNIAIYYKKKRLISIFTKILKELKNNKGAQDSLIQISKLLMTLFAKIGNKRPIYRDYMFKKAIPDKITDIFLQFYQNDMELVKSFSVYCFFAVRIVDHKTYFWTKGVINIFVELLQKAVNSEKTDETLIEYITLALYNLSLDNYDIQADLIDQEFLDLAKQIMVKFSKNYFIVFNVISCLRRIRDEEYMDKIAEELLFTFFALFDYFYLTVKKEVDNKNTNNKSGLSSNGFEILILKELVAILGNIVKDEYHCKPFVEKNLHLVLIDVKLSFSDYPKLIKNTIGALINLTTSNEIRESVSRVAAFIQSIYIILDKYKDNQAIIDYELKLIMNVVKNEITVKAFISGDMFFYLLLFLKNFINHEEIIFNSIKIIRTLILKKKGYDEFISKIVDFYSTIVINDEGETDKYKLYKLFVEDMIHMLDVKYEAINICIEVFLLLSYLTNQEENFKKILESSENFIKVMQKIINTYSGDEVVSKLISQCIAQLPIEEFESQPEK